MKALESRSGAAPPAPPPLRGIRVLVVEDNKDVLELIATVLVAAEADVTTADSAERAMQAIREKRPDVLLCDLHMPGVDGFELIHRVRAWERLSAPATTRIQAAAVSAYASIAQRLRHGRDEFQAILTKPVDPAELVRTVRDLYHSASA